MENELEKTTSVENNPDTKSLDERIKQLEEENKKLKQSVTEASADASKWKKKNQEQEPRRKAPY